MQVALSAKLIAQRDCIIIGAILFEDCLEVMCREGKYRIPLSSFEFEITDLHFKEYSLMCGAISLNELIFDYLGAK